ncbi:MAG: ATP-binding protein [Anaerolineae bacterium]
MNRALQRRLSVLGLWNRRGLLFLGGAAALLLIGYALIQIGSGGPSFLDPESRRLLSEQGTVRLATSTQNPPFGFREGDGIYRGFERELGDALASLLSVEVLLLPVDDGVSLVLEGGADAALGFVSTDSQGEGLIVTDPYLSSALTLTFASGREGELTLASLGGEVVTVRKAGPGLEALQGSGAISLLVAGPAEGLDAVRQRQASAFLGDGQAVRYLLEQGDGEGAFVAGPDLAPIRYSAALHENQAALLPILDRALSVLEESGELERLEARWFGTPAEQTVSPGGSGLVAVGLAFLVGALLSAVVWLAWSRGLRRELQAGRAARAGLEDRYRKLIEGGYDALMTISPADGGLLEANRRAERMTGYPRSELLTMDLGQLLSLKDRRRAMEGLQAAVLSGAGSANDVALVRKDGESIAVDLSAHMVSSDGRQVIQCILRDVTEAEAMRRELVERSQDLAGINAIAAALSWTVDLDSVLGQALDHSLTLTRMDAGEIYLPADGGSGFRRAVQVGMGEQPPDSRIGVSLAEKVVDRNRVVAVSDLAADPLLEGMRPPRGGFGSLAAVPLQAKGQVLGVLNLYRRTLHRFSPEDQRLLEALGKQIGVAVENAQLFRRLETAVEELSAVRQFNESILQSMTDGILVVDTAGQVTLANRAAGRMLGYGVGDLEGEDVDEVLGDASIMVRESLERGMIVTPREIEVPKRGGGTVPLAASISPLQGEKGGVRGGVVVVRDLSEARAMEAERRRLDRLALLGEMSAVVAHEVRNPLAAIAAGIQHLVSSSEPEDPSLESLQMILEESDRVNRIIEEILIISRPVRLKLAPSNISEVMERALRRLEPQARERGAAVRWHRDAELPPLRGDEARLEQAFSNLLQNALEAMPGGGELEVRADVSPKGKTAVVTVTDSGEGIADRDLGQIFEPFFTTKPGGTGLGLAIVRRIVEEHGGEISVESEPDTGTTFTVTLPLEG